MISKLLYIFCPATLLILLFGQGILIYLSLSYNGIPISNSLIQKYVPENLNLNSKETLFFLPCHIKLIEPELTQKADNLFQIDSPEIFVSWRPNLKNVSFKHWNIHGYSGTVSSKLYPSSFDLNQFNLGFSGSQIQNVRLHLQSSDKVVCLNYSAKAYLTEYDHTLEIREAIAPEKILPPSIGKTHPYHTLIKALDTSKNTYIKCFVERTEDGSFSLTTNLSSESIDIFENKLQSLQIQSQHSFNSPGGIVFFKAASFFNPEISIQSNALKGEIKLENQIQIGSIKIDADSLRLNDTIIDAISAQISPTSKESFSINGTLIQKNHLLSILSDYHTNAEENALRLKAHLNLNELQKDYLPQFKDLTVESSKTIFADAEITLDKNTNLIAAQGHLQGEFITANTAHFQYLSSHFQWIKKKLKTNSILRINDRNSLVKTEWDAESGDYICTLNGSTFSSDFNPILPKWWHNTFKDFSYTDDTKCFHDFAFYGTTQSSIPDFFLGSVQTTNLTYKGVPIKHGDLLVQNKNYCTEITLKDVQTQAGKAKGQIKITIKPDGFKKPESVRTKLESELTLKTAEKLFGNDIKKILSHFDSPYTHKVDFESAFFDPHYPQHKNKSYYNLSIERANSISFFKRPFYQFSAKIFGRNSKHHIRSASAEFGGGLLNFEADILKTLSDDPQLRINLSLTDCNYSQSIQDAFQNEFTKTAFDESQPLSLNLNIESKGSLLDLTKHNGFGDLTIHGSGLGKIHLLGPLSKALDEFNLSIGIFSLDHLEGNFLIQKEWIDVQNLEINGQQSHVFGQGRIFIPDQSIDFNMEIDLLKNTNLSFSKLGSFGKIFNPVTKILNFTVTGTLQDQKWRSIFDPRNLF